MGLLLARVTKKDKKAENGGTEPTIDMIYVCYFNYKRKMNHLCLLSP
jgi:hypothetical protein